MRPRVACAPSVKTSDQGEPASGDKEKLPSLNATVFSSFSSSGIISREKPEAKTRRSAYGERN